MSTEDYERGRADAHQELNTERHEANIKRFDAIEAQLKELADTVAMAKGGFRILIAVAGSSASIAVAITAALNSIWGHFK